MKVKILQRHTIGDSIFLQKILWQLLDKGHEVYWPLSNRTSFLADYINHANLHWDDSDADTVIDAESAVARNHPYDIMTVKYSIASETLGFDIDYSNWQKSIRINRNAEKEDELYERFRGEPYALVNENFGQGQRIRIPEPELRAVRLKNLPGYTIFDWLKVIENAQEIWTVDTSLVYLVEAFDTKAEKLKIWNRYQDHAQKCLSGILSKNWEWQ